MERAGRACSMVDELYTILLDIKVQSLSKISTHQP